jgi:hypothetical protein
MDLTKKEVFLLRSANRDHQSKRLVLLLTLVQNKKNAPKKKMEQLSTSLKSFILILRELY